jgi:hypothetical protein
MVHERQPDVARVPCFNCRQCGESAVSGGTGNRHQRHSQPGTHSYAGLKALALGQTVTLTPTGIRVGKGRSR